MLTTSPRSKALSVFGLAMINVVAIDSLRNLPTDAVFGLGIIGLYLIASVFFLIPCLLVTAELATHYPKTGGSYIWVREAFGKRWGFCNIYLQWIYNVVWYPTVLAFVASSVAYLFNPALASNKIYMVSMIIGMFSLATIVNCYGMELSSWISTLGATVGTLIPMLFIITLAVFWWLFGKPIAMDMQTQSVFPAVSQWRDLSLFGIILFSLMGFEMSSIHAGDVNNPKRDYPRALLISAVLIVCSAILASIAISMVVPKAKLSIVSGVNQAFAFFLQNLHLAWLQPIAIGMIILGGFCGMATWVIGPSKGLMVAASDGCAPKLFAKTNRRGAPVPMLITQAIVVLLLCSAYLLFPSVSSAYWVLSDLTNQLALLFYVLLFAAFIKLHLNLPRQAQCFRIPGGKMGGVVVGALGIIGCGTTLLLGFIPPDTIKVGSTWQYELTLIIGILVLGAPPLLLSKR